MRDAQNVDTARAPRFRFGILRVDDRAQDAESFAKKSKRVREGRKRRRKRRQLGLGKRFGARGKFRRFWNATHSARLNTRANVNVLFLRIGAAGSGGYNPPQRR